MSAIEITIQVEAKEIAALVVAIQERRYDDPVIADYLKRRAEALNEVHQ